MSEFERSLYNIYERCLETIQIDTVENRLNVTITSHLLKFIEIFLLFATLFFIIILIILHYNFVGSCGCLPILLNNYNSYHSYNNNLSFIHNNNFRFNCSNFGYL